MALRGRLLAVGAVALLGELALAAGFGLAGYRLAGGGGLGWLAGAVAFVALVIVWSRWMAPRASRRLPQRSRSAVAALLGMLVAGALALSGAGVAWAAGFVTLALVLAATQLAIPDNAIG